jgi:hypothetical protein
MDGDKIKQRYSTSRERVGSKERIGTSLDDVSAASSEQQLESVHQKQPQQQQDNVTTSTPQRKPKPKRSTFLSFSSQLRADKPIPRATVVDTLLSSSLKSSIHRKKKEQSQKSRSDFHITGIPIWRTSQFLWLFRDAYRLVNLGKNYALSEEVEVGHDGEEGWSSSNIFNQIKLLFSLKQHQKVLKPVLSTLDTLYGLNEKFVGLSSRRPQPDGKNFQRNTELEIMNQYFDYITQMKNGQLSMFAMPGGAQSRYSEIFYLVTRKSENSFTFTVFNTTDSIRFHNTSESNTESSGESSSCGESSEKVRYCGYISVDDIPPSRLLNKAFLFYIVQLKTSVSNNSEAIYQVLLFSFLVSHHCLVNLNMTCLNKNMRTKHIQ